MEIWKIPYNSINVQGVWDSESSWTLESIVQRGCAVSILEKFKTKLDMATNNLLKLTLLEQAGLEDLKGLLPISAFLCIPVLENYMDDSSQRFVPFLVFKDRKLSMRTNRSSSGSAGTNKSFLGQIPDFLIGEGD